MSKAIQKIWAAFTDAQDVHDDEWDKYVAENDGEEPNWDAPVISFDGENAYWYWGGDSEMEAKNSNNLLFSYKELMFGLPDTEIQQRIDSYFAEKA